MSDIVTYLKEDAKGERWITIMHRHVKVDGNGNIIGGLGGKFNGKPLSHATEHLSSPEGAKKNKATPETSSKKIKQALSILKNNPDLSSKEIKEIFMKNLGMTPGGAAVYLTKVKKLHAASQKDEEPKKEVEKPKPEKKEVEKPVEKTPEKEDKKEESGKAEKSSKKLHQAIEIFKSMPNATSKEVQAKFKSEIGMSPGMAAVYYHKIKNQFGPKDVNKTINKLYNAALKKKGAPLEHEFGGKSDIDPLIKKLQDEHPELSATKAGSLMHVFHNDAKKSTEKEVEKVTPKEKPKSLDDIIADEYEKGTFLGNPLYNIAKVVHAKHPDEKFTDIASKLSNHHNKIKDDKIHKEDEKPSGNDVSQEDEISQYVKKHYKTHEPTDIVNHFKKKYGMKLNDAIETFLKHKDKHVKDELDPVVDKLIRAKNDDDAHHYLMDEFNIDKEKAKRYWDNHPKVKKLNDELSKSVAHHFEKYQMGLVKQGEALKQLTDKHNIHFTKAEDVWAEHKNKVEAEDNKKQEIADKLYAEMKDKGHTWTEIATHLKKELGYPTNVIKYIDKAHDNYGSAEVKKHYDMFKAAQFNNHDDIVIASKLQKDHGMSYDDAWKTVEKLHNMHKEKSWDHPEQAVEIYKKGKKADKDFYSIVDDIGLELGLNASDSENLAGYASKQIKDSNKAAAMEIYKKGQAAYKMKHHIIKDIQSELDVDEHDATKLYNIAMNSVENMDTPTQKSYSDVKNKASEHTGGTKIYNEHEENAHEIEPEHVKEYKSKVQKAKDTDAHTVFDHHEHLIKPGSMDYYKQPQKIKNMSQGVYDYTGSHYQSINSGLREDYIPTSYKKTIKHIDEAFKHPSARVKQDTMVYRGYTSKFANSLEPGDILQDKGYMSTASYQAKAESWASSDGAVVHILLPKGANAMTVQHISAHSSEAEVLLNRNSKLRIVKKEVRPSQWGGDPGVTLYAEYILEDEPPVVKKPKVTKKSMKTESYEGEFFETSFKKWLTKLKNHIE